MDSVAGCRHSKLSTAMPAGFAADVRGLYKRQQRLASRCPVFSANPSRDFPSARMTRTQSPRSTFSFGSSFASPLFPATGFLRFHMVFPPFILTGMMPVALPTKSCKSCCFAIEAEALQKDLQNNSQLKCLTERIRFFALTKPRIQKSA